MTLVGDLGILVVVVFCICFGNTATIPDDNAKLKTNGQIIFGGLFPMHEKGPPGKNCGKIKEEKGIQRLEAMMYAVDRINNDTSLLPNITIGVHVLDTCSRDTYALEQSMDFIKAQFSTLDVADYLCKDGSEPKYKPSKPVAGVIGAASSSVSIMVANILRLFKIPQISYASTSQELSDKNRFGYFSRVVPPDTYQAEAMADIAVTLGWTYYSTVADEGQYGEKGIAAFKAIADGRGICEAGSFIIGREATEEDFNKTVLELEKIARKDGAKTVIMFVNEDNCRRLLRASLRLGITNTFNWLASDSWGTKKHPVDQLEQAAAGAITVLPKRKELEGFNDYFKSRNPGNNKRNPWFHDFWEQHFQCDLDDPLTRENCSNNVISKKTSGYEQEGYVQFVVDAVYALAYALQDLHADKCPHTDEMCPEMDPTGGATLLDYIRNVKFNSSSGSLVRFNKNGDGLGRYNVYQFQMVSGKYKYVNIGEWTDSLNLNLSKTRWPQLQNATGIPKSVCSEPCEKGYAKQGDSCCWHCVACGQYSYLENEVTCAACHNGTIPNENKTGCIHLPIQYMQWSSPWAIIPAIFASFGIVCTFLVTCIFIKYNATPVIMASGRELCYVLLFGIFGCYSMTFILLAKPSVFNCSIVKIGTGLSLVICYSAILTKTNRISRIFNRGVKGLMKRPSYTSPKSQLVICTCLTSVQVIGVIAWLIMDIPDTTKVFPNRETVILRCKASNLAIVLSLLYNMLLIILCTVYAFKTRKIPENFNEAKYIAFTMYSTCIVWLAFVPIYFGTNSDFKIQITTLCMGISISATVALGCLFAPKVYIVLFQPHKNVRQSNSTMMHSSSSKSIRPFFGKSVGLAVLIAQNTAGVQSTTSDDECGDSVCKTTLPANGNTQRDSLMTSDCPHCDSQSESSSENETRL